MSEFRRDRTTGQWVIIAPERNKRPHRTTSNLELQHSAGPFDPSCPFCPGNEAMLPAILEELGCERPPGWRCRAIPNKFPIVPTPATGSRNQVPPGHGIHEVIIESAQHNADLEDLSEPAIRSVIELWHRRFTAALSRPDIRCICLFRNHGNAAGASLIHPHSQMIALPDLPPRLKATLTWACGHHAETGKCVTCAELEREKATGERLVERSEGFTVLVPFAASHPLEQWIVPRHQASFAHITAAQRNMLADVLQRSIRRMKAAAGAVAYNCTLEPGSPDDSLAGAAHWSMRIVPDLTTPGGFEMLSHLPVNPSSPEQDARILRNVNC